MSNSILIRMGSSVPGDLTRANAPHVVESAVLNSATPPLAFGVPLALEADGSVRPITAGDVTTDVYGVLIRPYPFQSRTYDTPMGAGVPDPNVVGSVVRQGYVAVKINGSATPVRGGPVYVRTVTGTDTVIGGFSAAADSTNSFVLVGVTFTGGKDADGNGEIFITSAVTG